MKNSFLSVLVLTSSLLVPLTGHAQDLGPAAPAPAPAAAPISVSTSLNSGNLSLLGGIGLLNNGGGAGFTYGVSAVVIRDSVWQLGAQFNSFSPSSSLGITNVDGVIRWAPGGTIDGLKIGILAGAEILSNTAPNTVSTTNFNYGLSLIYDVDLSLHWSLGPQVDFIWNTGSNTYTNTNIIAALRYWF